MRYNKKESKLETFRAASRRYSDASIFMHEAIARRAGLTGADHKYLGLILQQEKLSAGQISSLTGLTTGAVTGLLDRLEKKSLVKRVFSKDDRRKVMVIPIEENIMELLQPFFRDLQTKTAALLSTFSESEIETIQSYFEKATSVMIETTNDLNHPKK